MTEDKCRREITLTELKAAVLDLVESYSRQFRIAIDAEFAAVKLFEEVGEFAQALLAKKGKTPPSRLSGDTDAQTRLGEELADVVCLAILNAHMHEIDLTAAVLRKWVNRAP